MASGTPMGQQGSANDVAVTLVLEEDVRGSSLSAFSQELAVQAPVNRDYATSVTLAQKHGPDPRAKASVSAWARRSGYTVTFDDATRRARVSGSQSKLAKDFGVRLHAAAAVPGGVHQSGAMVLPKELQGKVLSVSRLAPTQNNRTHFLLPAANASQGTSYLPELVAQAYNFPVLPNGGAGQVINIGIAELGGAVDMADVATVKGEIGAFNLTESGVNGAGPVSDPTGADVEVALDWQVIARIIKKMAPNATLNIYVKYGANDNTDFADLLASFASDGIDYASVSTSWGGPLSTYAASDLTTMHDAIMSMTAVGIVPTFASGDGGAEDGTTALTTDYPAEDADGLACGGSKATINAAGSLTAEVVWNELASNEGAGGGGVGAGPVPPYQANNGITPTNPVTGATGRGVPDISGNADPTTGYQILAAGAPTVVGGTSAVAPLVAAYAGLVKALTGVKLGDLHEQMYAIGAKGKGYNSITSGNNYIPGQYNAGPGYNEATGWGSINGTQLTPVLSTTPATPAVKGPRGPSGASLG